MQSKQRLKRFKVISKLYKRREQSLAVQAREKIDAHKREQRQLNTLDELIGEYHNASNPVVGEKRLPGLMRLQRQFIGSLGFMRQNQARSAGAAQKISQQALEIVVNARQKTDAIDILAQNLQKKIRTKMLKREQCEMDDISAQKKPAEGQL